MTLHSTLFHVILTTQYLQSQYEIAFCFTTVYSPPYRVPFFTYLNIRHVCSSLFLLGPSNVETRIPPSHRRQCHLAQSGYSIAEHACPKNAFRI